MQKNKKQVKQLVKLQKIRVKSNSYDFKRIVLLYGIYGLRALEGIRLKEIQIEAVKKTIKKNNKKIRYNLGFNKS